MAVFTEPTKWAQTLGKDADVTTIPNTAGETDPSIDKIFPSVFSVPLANGGRAIPRSVLNGLFKLLGDWVYYIQNGGIASYSASFDYAVGSFVKYNDDFYRCIQANSATAPKAPTDSAYWLRITTTADSPTSEIKIWPSSTIPDGFLLCNGSAVSRTTYANLFSKIGTTFGSGDGSTTFNIPDLRDRYIIGANTNALGVYLAEQLPNILGHLHMLGGGINDTTAQDGAFVNEYPATETLSGGVSTNTYGYGRTELFNAHNFNTIYTDNGKVYPASIALNFIIKT